jgi:hypothetical protein
MPRALESTKNKGLKNKAILDKVLFIIDNLTNINIIKIY